MVTDHMTVTRPHLGPFAVETIFAKLLQNVHQVLVHPVLDYIVDLHGNNVHHVTTDGQSVHQLSSTILCSNFDWHLNNGEERFCQVLPEVFAGPQSNESSIVSALPQTLKERHGSSQQGERRGMSLLLWINHLQDGVQAALRLQDVRCLMCTTKRTLNVKCSRSKKQFV